MKLRVLKEYRDLERDEIMKPGAEFETGEERAAKLISIGFVEEAVEIMPEPEPDPEAAAPAPKKAVRKKKTE